MSNREQYVVMATLRAEPGQGEALLHGLQQHAVNCLRDEPDCLAFDISRVPDDPDQFVLYEVYRDRDGFEAHKASRHFAWFGESYGHLIAARDLRFLARIEGPPTLGRRRRVLVVCKPLHNYPAIWQPLIDAGLDVVIHQGPALRDEAASITALEGVFATIASIEPYSPRVLSAARDLRIIARLGVGHDQIDLDAATARGVAVAMTFGANHDAVADHALALTAALLHQLPAYDRKVRQGGWGTHYHRGLSDLTIGIIGFGRIGRAFAKRCKAFSARILVADPLLDAATVSRLGAELVSLDKLLAGSDVVSVHSPLNDQTRHLIDADKLAAMKDGAILINTARGPAVDERALIAALEAGRLAGAGLDVFEDEPLQGSPLGSMDNVILTPHVAGLSEPAIITMGKRCVSNILSIMAGRDPGGGLLLNPPVLGMNKSAG